MNNKTHIDQRPPRFSFIKKADCLFNTSKVFFVGQMKLYTQTPGGFLKAALYQKPWRICFSILFTLFVFSLTSYAQTKTVTHDVVFETDSQSMWGPGNNFSINRTIPLFDRFESDFSFDTRPNSIFSVAGFKFGAGIWGRFAFGVGPLALKVSGFEGGDIAVKYPIETSLVLPEDSTFNAGETVTIKTDYTVQDDFELNTIYPATGDVRIDLPIMFDMSVGIDVCLFECFSYQIFPPEFLGVPPPLIDITWVIVGVNKDEITYPCPMFPPVCTTPMPSGGGRIPAGSPLSGDVKIPNVETTASLSGKDLQAFGEDPYLIPSLDIIQLLSFAPPPVGPIFGILSSSRGIPPGGIRDFGGTRRFITLSWTLFTMNLEMPISQTQQFTFHPTVNLKLKLPVDVAYTYSNITSGVITTGRDSIIDVPLGADLKIDYPCNMSHMDMNASYVISTNDFSNRTYDHVDVQLVFTAFKFGISFPDFDIIPRFCISIPIVGDLCFQLTVPGFELSIGPLVTPPPVVLAEFDLPDYVNRTWVLGGFTEQFIDEPFRLVPRAIRMNVVASNASCYGSATGSATFDATGVTAPLSYQWSTGLTSKDLSGAPAGRQYVIATDKNKCRIHADAFIGQPDPIITRTSATNLLCYNDLSGKATVTASGGTPSYTYQWSNGQSSAAPTALAAGKHSVTVMDANGCKQTDSILLTQPPDIRATVLHTANPTCNGKSDGAISLDVSGGRQPYFYQWTNGASDKDIRLLPGGIYSVSMKDANGCIRNLSTTLVEPAPVVIELTLLSDVACLGGKNGSILANVTGGTLPYKYAWKNAALELSNTSNLVSGLPAGIYSLAVHDKNNCTADNNIEITAPQFLLESTVSKTDLSCFNGADGTAQVQVTGGTAPYLINWSNGASGATASNLKAGTYTITVADSRNCTTINKAVIVSPANMIVNVAVKNVSCVEQQDGELEVAVSKGVPPYTYQWSTGSSASSITNLAAGMYTLTVTDKKGCVNTTDVTVTSGNGDCLFIPDAFSPNNDGVNDRWVLRNIRLYPNNSMQVVNQWGQELYSASPYLEPWDGRHNGNLLPPGTYYYIFTRGDGSASYTHSLTILK